MSNSRRKGKLPKNNERHNSRQNRRKENEEEIISIVEQDSNKKVSKKSKPQKNKQIKNINKIKVTDIISDKMDYEVLISGKYDLEQSDDSDDDFEQKFVTARQNKGSKVYDLMVKNPFINIKQPHDMLYLTKVGHGEFSADTMCMLEFFDTKTDLLVEEFAKILDRCPNIKILQLYACKSGLMHKDFFNHTLIQRIQGAQSDELRFEYGQLSFAEFFTIKLSELYRQQGKTFPEGLCVVACLGDVKNNNGKPGISGNIKYNFFVEDYMAIDVNSKLLKIDCTQFLTQYYLEVVNTNVNAIIHQVEPIRPVILAPVIEEPIIPIIRVYTDTQTNTLFTSVNQNVNSHSSINEESNNNTI